MKIEFTALLALLASSANAFTPSQRSPGFAKNFGKVAGSTELNISGGANPYEGEMYDGEG